MNIHTPVTAFRKHIAYAILLALLWVPLALEAQTYCWTENYDTENAIAKRINVPEGFTRTEVAENSFAHWLRHLPLKKGKPPVLLHDGSKKWNQNAHYAVVDIDTGKRNLQQCADACMRLKAEYDFSLKQYDNIHFNFTSGDNAAFTQWAEGYRPRINKKVTWTKSKSKSFSYKNFKRYMRIIFSYAGTYSLSKEMQAVSLEEMQPGDVFIQGGFPGHAVMIVDMAENKSTGKKIFLLVQSYMPAQDIHVLINPNNTQLNPWYRTDFAGNLKTPEWTFKKTDLKRFKN
ncbi:MAG: DUF4846 domain-containing protein [bacterium]|nr:DUF4846 domain-containing protein [bacterium]